MLANALDPALDRPRRGARERRRRSGNGSRRALRPLLAYRREPPLAARRLLARRRRRHGRGGARCGRPAGLGWRGARRDRALARPDRAAVDARATLEEDVEELAALVGADGVRRVVASGNGAAYYVAVALWLASLESGKGPEVVAVPSGLLARGAFAWRPGDVFLAVSSSGEFRDLVEAVDGGAPAPYGAVTSNAGSTLGARAGARALVSVPSQRAVTHTQAFCGNVVAALRVWAAVTADDRPRTRRSAVCPTSSSTRSAAPARWVDELGAGRRRRPRSSSAADPAGRPRWRRRCC